MKCPYCAHPETSVLDSRDAEDFEITRRRRECEQVQEKVHHFMSASRWWTCWSTRRTARASTSTAQSSKRHYPGLREARRRKGKNRGDGRRDREGAAPQEDTEVTSVEIGELVMKKLKAVDKVAYIRFASVYRDFTDVADFEDELHRLLKKKG